MLIINQQKKIFIAKRIDSKGNTWQMPQGGIDIGETPSKAVMREMQEEIGCNQAQIILESKHWYSYRIPSFLVPKLWDGQFHGQAQKWFLVQFLGKDCDINLDTSNPEFCEWRWVKLDQLVHTVVPFKRKLYKTIVNEFKSFLT